MARRWQALCGTIIACGLCCVDLVRDAAAGSVGIDALKKGDALMLRIACCCGVLSLLCGCADSEPEPSGTDVSAARMSEAAAAPASDSAPARRKFAPLRLGGDATGDSMSERSAASSASDDRISAIIEALKPMQVLLGQWRGTTRRVFEGFKAVDHHEWVWDLTSQDAQPALVMKSDKSPYVREARLTWLPDTTEYQLTLTDADGGQRVLRGTFTRPVADTPGDDGKLHRTFVLTLTQTDPPDAAEYLQLAINQQENDRYLLEVSRQRGRAAFRRLDTVSTQREGTSFALSDSDYGDKTCIISQGLGTIAVTYQGRTYWVCCSGCKAAFEEDPERWIKRAAAAKAGE